jgi:hypothetical protein
LWLAPLSHEGQLLALSISSNENLRAEEREALANAKDAEARLKLYLSIADARLKNLLLHTRKLDKESSAKAALGFRAAVSGADDCVAKEQADKNYRKLLTQLNKAMRKHNFTLLQALEKVADGFRAYIQSAYEVSQRVQNGTEIRLARFQ